MQYFTFLGMGSNYKEAIYFFQDNHEHEYCSKYVQEAIIQEYRNQISDIYVFCTEKSYDNNGNSLYDLIKKECDKEIKFIFINDNVQTEEIVSKMSKVLNDDFIIDITHSFRSIPLSVMLITKYLECASGYHLKHLYYGNYNAKKEEGIIVDLINQYNHSHLINEIEAFDKYLKVSSESLFIYKEDQKIQNLLKAFEDFNKMVEYCEFNKSIDCIRKIIDFSKNIKKDDNYILIHPYLERIIDKFKEVNTNQLNSLKKISLIKILLKHNLYQVAITFTDQLIREELVHYAYFPNTLNFKSEILKTLSPKRRNLDIYHLSQDLLYYLNIRQSNKAKIDKDIEPIREKYMNFKKNTHILDYKSIDEFYFKIRNKINHGDEIESNVDIQKIIFNCLNSLERFIKEG